MSGTTNLNAPLVVASQNQKEVTINAAFARFDAAISETFDADLTSGNVTVTAEQGRACLMVRATNVATTGRTVTLPQVERVFLVSNPAASSDDVGFVRGSTTVTLAPGETATVRTDGTTDGLVVLVLGSASGGGGGGIALEDEGTTVTGGPHTTLNFTGAGVSVANAGGGEATVTISGGGSGIALEDEGTTVTGGPHTTLNFTGAGVSVADAGSGEATVTISGGGGGADAVGRAHVVPALTDFTWVNQTGSTATQRSYGISMARPAGAAFGLLVKAAPSPPYEIRIRFNEARQLLNNVALVFGWRDSASGLVQFGMFYYDSGLNQLALISYTAAFGFVATAAGPVAQSHRTEWVRIADDNTNRTVSVSSDGDEWLQVLSVVRTSHITPDEVLFALGNPSASMPAGLTILSWEEL